MREGYHNGHHFGREETWETASAENDNRSTHHSPVCVQELRDSSGKDIP
jgi:hypothetical protein